MEQGAAVIVEPMERTQGLYRSEFEHDACGIGALAHLKGRKSHQMIDDALSVLVNLEHRGGVGLENPEMRPHLACRR